MEKRRLAQAAVVFALMFVSVAGAVGFATDPVAPVPASFSIVARQPGDSGVYVAYHLLNDAIEGPYPHLEFEQTVPGITRDRGGIAHWASSTVYAAADWHSDRDRENWTYDIQTKLEIARDIESNEWLSWTIDLGNELYVESEATSLTGLGLIESDIDGNVTIRSSAFNTAQNEALFLNRCVLEANLAGTQFDPSEPLVLFESCALYDVAVEESTKITRSEVENRTQLPTSHQVYVSEDWQFEAVGLDKDGRLVLSLAGAEGRDRALRVWLDSTVPYPVQLAWADPEIEGRWDVLVLEQFTPGSFFDSSKSLPRDLDTSLRLGELERHGLPEEGMEGHPYLPSEAYADALEIDNTIQIWFDEHPNARVTHTSGSRYESVYGDTELAWVFDYSTPEVSLHFRVTKFYEGPQSATDGVPSDSVLGIPRGAEVSSVGEYNTEEDVQARLAQPIPLVPYAAELVRMYDDFSQSEPGYRVWSINPNCSFLTLLTSCLADPNPNYSFAVGVDSLGFYPKADPETRSAGYGINATGDLLAISGEDMLPSGRSILSFYIEQRNTAVPGATAGPSNFDAVADQPAWGRPPGSVMAGSSFLAALTAALYFFWPSIKPVAFGLFSRVRSEKALDQPIRRRIHQLIEAEPGIHFKEIVRRIDVSTSATEHHLRKLVDTSHLLRKEAGGYVSYFPVHTDRRIMDAAPFLRNKTARFALEEIVRTPGIHGGALAERMGVNRGTVRHHMQRLVEAGIIVARKDGRSIGFRATDVGEHFALSVIAA